LQRDVIFFTPLLQGVTDKFRAIIYRIVAGLLRSLISLLNTRCTLKDGNDVSTSMAKDSLLWSSSTLNNLNFLPSTNNFYLSVKSPSVPLS
jgi:hypothetical protein